MKIINKSTFVVSVCGDGGIGAHSTLSTVCMHLNWTDRKYLVTLSACSSMIEIARLLHVFFLTLFFLCDPHWSAVLLQSKFYLYEKWFDQVYVGVRLFACLCISASAYCIVKRKQWFGRRRRRRRKKKTRGKHTPSPYEINVKSIQCQRLPAHVQTFVLSLSCSTCAERVHWTLGSSTCALWSRWFHLWMRQNWNFILKFKSVEKHRITFNWWCLHQLLVYHSILSTWWQPCTLRAELEWYEFVIYTISMKHFSQNWNWFMNIFGLYWSFARINGMVGMSCADSTKQMPHNEFS